jgi:hypothetical protein
MHNDVISLKSSAFDLVDHPSKDDPTVIAGDEQHLAAIAAGLAQSVAAVSDDLQQLRAAPGARDGRRWTGIWRSTG